MKVQLRGVDTLHSATLVVSVYFVADKTSATSNCSYSGSAATHKWVVDDLVGVGVQLNAPPGQFYGERGRVANPFGGFRGHVPNAPRVVEKLVASDGVTAPVHLGALVAIFTKHQDIFVLIPDAGI